MRSETNGELSPSAIKDMVSSESIERIDTAYEFKQRGASNLLLLMKEELEEIQKNHEGKPEDMEKFFSLFTRYLSERSEKLVWDNINPPPDSMLVPYESAQGPSSDQVPALLNKLAVIKLNGGLGTSMGCTGPKSAIEVKDHLNFIDLSVRQIEHLNAMYNTNVPMILMNSFNTSKETAILTKKYNNVWSFEQSAFPRIFSSTLLPVLSDSSSASDKQFLDSKEGWYPPGHGNLFESLEESGLLDKLISEGKEYVFISNIDNLKAIVDIPILNYLDQEKIDFLMEVTPKTISDIKGGTLIEYKGILRLLEIAQVPEYHKTDFTSIRKFKIFNTNSIWVSLHSIKHVLQNKLLNLEVIENKKKLSNGSEVIQLETAIGASIRYFNNPKGMIVPRTRFLPVKTCSDLFLLQSTLFNIKHGTLAVSNTRIIDALPNIKLVGKHFKTVESFQKHIKGPINIDELDHLTISGDVYLGKNIVLKGTVIIIADEGHTIIVPDGSILDNKIVTGNLSILDH
ncbi:UTP--glucose-1-phosphate uridylyltransferase [Nematocida sp. AWRm80]|nr:UTP--glucose-1-phosphate uridylyltransferase [Nematocida sp. AWRm80]